MAVHYPRRVSKIKRARRYGEAWDRVAGRTSNLPFAAISAGRNTLQLGEIAWWQVGVGVGAYALFLVIHGWAFGVSPLP